MSVYHTHLEVTLALLQKVTPVLQRCHSESETLIKCALSRGDSQPDLIADFSKPYCLPLCKGKHADMKAISTDTVSNAHISAICEQCSSSRMAGS